MEDIRRSGVDGKGLDIPIGIGEDTQIRKAIVDKNARIGRNVLVRKVQKMVNDSIAISLTSLIFILKLNYQEIYTYS